MGDRCYVEITVRRCDLEKWLELGYEQEFEEDDESAPVQLIDEQRNYGVSFSEEDIAEGCPMYGWHSEGGDYPAMIFAFDGKVFTDCMATNATPVVRWFEGGPDAGDVQAAKDYYEIQSKVEAILAPIQEETK